MNIPESLEVFHALSATMDLYLRQVDKLMQGLTQQPTENGPQVQLEQDVQRAQEQIRTVGVAAPTGKAGQTCTASINKIQPKSVDTVVCGALPVNRVQAKFLDPPACIALPVNTVKPKSLDTPERTDLSAASRQSIAAYTPEVTASTVCTKKVVYTDQPVCIAPTLHTVASISTANSSPAEKSGCLVLPVSRVTSTMRAPIMSAVVEHRKIQKPDHKTDTRLSKVTAGNFPEDSDIEMLCETSCSTKGRIPLMRRTQHQPETVTSSGQNSAGVIEKDGIKKSATEEDLTAIKVTDKGAEKTVMTPAERQRKCREKRKRAGPPEHSRFSPEKQTKKGKKTSEGNGGDSDGRSPRIEKKKERNRASSRSNIQAKQDDFAVNKGESALFDTTSDVQERYQSLLEQGGYDLLERAPDLAQEMYSRRMPGALKIPGMAGRSFGFCNICGKELAGETIPCMFCAVPLHTKCAGGYRQCTNCKIKHAM